MLIPYFLSKFTHLTFIQRRNCQNQYFPAMACILKSSQWFCILLTIHFLFHLTLSDEILNDTFVMEDDILINPFDVQEEGCPIVGERSELNLTMLDGEWRMPYASLNWIADIGMALYNRSVSMSLITAICPRIILSHSNVSSQTNVTWTLLWKCPKLHGEFELGCWPQSNLTVSKYICWNNKENRDLYMMVSATDHDQFIVLVRCSPGEPGKPSEGMSWAILSRQIPLNLDIADALLSLLVGYGFDVNEFQTQLAYDDCPAVV